MEFLFSSHRWMTFEMQQYKVLDSLTRDRAARIGCDEQTGKSQPPKSFCQFCFFFFFLSNKPVQTVLLALEKMGTFKMRLFPPIWHSDACWSQAVAFTVLILFPRNLPHSNQCWAKVPWQHLRDFRLGSEASPMGLPGSSHVVLEVRRV